MGAIIIYYYLIVGEGDILLAMILLFWYEIKVDA